MCDIQYFDYWGEYTKQQQDTVAAGLAKQSRPLAALAVKEWCKREVREDKEKALRQAAPLGAIPVVDTHTSDLLYELDKVPEGTPYIYTINFKKIKDLLKANTPFWG